MVGRATVLTAIYDSYDSLKPTMQQTGVDVDWICVTDDPTMQDQLGWRVICEPRPGVHPCRAAKHPKMEPWRYTDTVATVWIDASFRVVSSEFVIEALEVADPIAQWVHPWRSCAYEEADESLRLEKYRGEPIVDQMTAYLKDGFPSGWGLWATGVIARHRTSTVEVFGMHWLSDVYRWSFQDQLSEAPVLWDHGLRPSGFPGTHLANSWLSYQGSERH